MKLLEFVKKHIEEPGGVKLFPWQEKLLFELEKNDFKRKCFILGRKPQVAWLQLWINELRHMKLLEHKESNARNQT